MNGHVKTITGSQKTMTPTTNLKYDPQYAAAAAEGVLTLAHVRPVCAFRPWP